MQILNMRKMTMTAEAEAADVARVPSDRRSPAVDDE